MKFVEWVDGDHILMERYEDYNWGSSYFDHEGPAYLEEVEFRFFPDHPTRLAALEAGDVNMIEQLPDVELARFRATPTTRYRSVLAGCTELHDDEHPERAARRSTCPQRHCQCDRSADTG